MSKKVSRYFRKFYVFIFFIVGISFYTFVKNFGFPEPLDPPRSHKNEPNLALDISAQLNAIEGEIASQKLYSNSLLQKLQHAALSETKPKKHEVPPEPSYTKLGDEKAKMDLASLQKLLQDETHVGEVHSEAHDTKNDIQGHENTDEDDGAMNHNGEVIDNVDTSDGSVIAVLIFVCNRPSVSRCLDSLLKLRPSSEKFPIIVSQDCGLHPETTAVLESYGSQITRIVQPDQSEIHVPPKEKKLKGYYNIARHYGWALNQTFLNLGYSNVLIVEDDLDLAPDFFEYFSATLPIMKADKSIWCVSAWNDNGKPKRINNTAHELLYRTDFFPGLGWMLTKEIWNELMVKWPRGYWDDWMRETAQRKERVCIRPEISRTITFGKYGVSHGTYYQNHLRHIKLNDKFVPFTNMDLTYLYKDTYDVNFVRQVYSSQPVQTIEELNKLSKENNKDEFRLTYRTQMDFRSYAKKLELMDDFRAGVPRTAYRGVVPFMYNNHRVYLAPGANWVSYQP